MATRKKKNNIGAFGHPIYGKGFAKYGEMRPNGSSEIPNDLEEAAEEYEKRHTYQRYDGGGLTPEYDATLAEAFIAGYNLCKEQIEALRRAVNKLAKTDVSDSVRLSIMYDNLQKLM